MSKKAKFVCQMTKTSKKKNIKIEMHFRVSLMMYF